MFSKKLLSNPKLDFATHIRHMTDALSTTVRPSEKLQILNHTFKVVYDTLLEIERTQPKRFTGHDPLSAAIIKILLMEYTTLQQIPELKLKEFAPKDIETIQTKVIEGTGCLNFKAFLLTGMRHFHRLDNAAKYSRTKDRSPSDEGYLPPRLKYNGQVLEMDHKRKVAGEGNFGKVYEGSGKQKGSALKRSRKDLNPLAYKLLENEIFYNSLYFKDQASGYRYPSNKDPKYQRIISKTPFHPYSMDGIQFYPVLERLKSTKPEIMPHIFNQIINQLSELHRLGLMHRDIKVDNFLFCLPQKLHDYLQALMNKVDQETAIVDYFKQYPEELQVKLIDLGLAGIEGNVSDRKEMVGTPEYMSFELLSWGDQGFPADVRAVALAYTHLMIGTLPYEEYHDVHNIEQRQTHVQESIQTSRFVNDFRTRITRNFKQKDFAGFLYSQYSQEPEKRVALVKLQERINQSVSVAA